MNLLEQSRVVEQRLRNTVLPPYTLDIEAADTIALLIAEIAQERAKHIESKDAYHVIRAENDRLDAELAKANSNHEEFERKFYLTQDALEQVQEETARMREKAYRLWMLLDGVDTADDMAKSDDEMYRSICRQFHAKRWAYMTGGEVDAARAALETKK